MAGERTPPARVLAAYGLHAIALRRIVEGLIHATWFVDAGEDGRYIVQRLHAAISPDVNDTVAAVCTHFAARGMTTPRLVRTVAGDAYVIEDGACWRVLTYVPGTSFSVVPDDDHAEAAGALLARFHAALADFPGAAALPVATVHEIGRHLDALERALREHAGHPRYAAVRATADRLFAHAAGLAPVTSMTLRAVHGDPKISNVLFDAQGRAVCWIDLDTIGRMRLPWELGDALRSWCNPVGEDHERTTFSISRLVAAARGYAHHSRGFITAEEIADIVPATETIYTELAARFLADALIEAYFAWDPHRYPTRSAHNLARANGQLNAALDLARQRDDARDAIASAFGT